MGLALAPELLVALTGQPAKQLKTFLSPLPPETLRDPGKLADILEEHDLLTPYQAVHVREGRGAGLIVGQYVVLDEIGHGSVGMVYKSRHRLMERLAALKVFTPERNDHENLKRFLREIQATAQLDHPHLVKAYEAGEHQGAYFLAMEYVEGKDLHDTVDREGPFSLDRALDCFVQAAAGLGYAHGLGMVHRDVKPANIMLGADGRVRVLDLGLVRFIKGFSSMATSLDGSVRGTAAFMAPEQAVSIRNADHRSDIYALGSSLYFALTSQPMFEEKALMQQLLAHQRRPAPRLRAARPDLPESVERLYQLMVAKDPALRPQSMAQVIEGLRAAAKGQPLPPDLDASADALPVAPPDPGKDPPSTPVWKRIFPFLGTKE
jgi:eukaryotic-like serine/threonine-protein kinase